MFEKLYKLTKKYIKSSNHLQYAGPYSSWDEAMSKSIGYDSDVVLKKVENATLNVLNGLYKYERDGTNFDELPEENKLLNKLKEIDLNNKSLLDIGGGLGSLYINYMDFFHKSNVNFLVLEQQNFCLKGNELKKTFNLQVNYYESLMNIQTIDVAIFSSTLQYFENWKETINEILAFLPEHIYIDRHPLSNKESEIFVQLNNNYYEEKITYPIHILNQDEFLKAFKGYKLVDSWVSSFDPSYFKGFHLQKFTHSF